MNVEGLVEQIRECGLRVRRDDDGQFHVEGVLQDDQALVIREEQLLPWWSGVTAGMALVSRRIRLSVLGDGTFVMTYMPWWRRVAARWRR